MQRMKLVNCDGLGSWGVGMNGGVWYLFDLFLRVMAGSAEIEVMVRLGETIGKAIIGTIARHTPGGIRILARLSFRGV